MSTPLDSAVAETPVRPLGRAVAADLEALRNDVEEARGLAAEYQRELAGKVNDYAILRQVFERTRKHLIDLTATVSRLREERHQFANEAMKAVALERKLAEVTAERDRYKAALDDRDAWAG